jgi:lantibiotic modifying enzyme
MSSTRQFLSISGAKYSANKCTITTVFGNQTRTGKPRWCHGAPGIGLARIHSLRYLDDATVRSEIDISIKTTQAQGFGGNHSLCHGDLGNLELLLQANQTIDAPHGQWQATVDERTAAVLRDIERQGYLCGVPLGVETPGLLPPKCLSPLLKATCEESGQPVLAK